MSNTTDSKALRGEYRKLYRQVSKRLRKDVAPGGERDGALSDFADMLGAAQEESTPVSELLPDGFEPFCRSLLEALPAMTAKDKWVYRHRKARRAFGAICAVIAAAMIVAQLGYLAVHLRGVEYIAD